MEEDVLVPGPRDVRGTLDHAGSEACVVACPPHPRHGGSRSDARLRAVSDALGERGVACLRIDYGPWDEGYGERADAVRAVEHARDRFARTGLFGYSFGASVALVAAPEADVRAVSTLSPTARLGDEDEEPLDVVAAVEAIEVPIQVVVGTRDTTVEWEPVIERARDLGHAVEEVGGDHFLAGRRVAEPVAEFLAGNV